MRKKLFAVIFTAFSTFAYTQESFEDLKEPYVKEIGNNNVIEDYTLITNKNTTDNFQIGIYAIVDKSLIHRDYFVAFTSLYSNIFLEEFINELGGDDNVIIETLKKPIGELDIKLQLSFTEEGLQMSMTNNGERKNETITWKELLKS